MYEATEAGVTAALAGRAVLVTGGSSGIGAAVVRRFQAAGDHVTVLDRHPPTSDVAFVRGDVTQPGDHLRAVEAAAAAGRLDVLVANAGIHDGGLTLGSNVGVGDLAEVFHRILAVNVIGYALAVQACAAQLRLARGCVLLTLSDASFDVHGNGSGAAYAASKHAGLGLLRAAARDLAPVRVNAVAPGGVATAIAVSDGRGDERRLVADPAELARRVAGRTLLGRGASLDELAEAFYFLASEAAAAITGQVVRVDGGLLA
jgi:2,3-dihydroxy-2,3-dihydrophenylpropionate dehydrogenase